MCSSLLASASASTARCGCGEAVGSSRAALCASRILSLRRKPRRAIVRRHSHGSATADATCQCTVTEARHACTLSQVLCASCANGLGARRCALGVPQCAARARYVLPSAARCSASNHSPSQAQQQVLCTCLSL
jgi:hypothetical protein